MRHASAKRSFGLTRAQKSRSNASSMADKRLTRVVALDRSPTRTTLARCGIEGYPGRLPRERARRLEVAHDLDKWAAGHAVAGRLAAGIRAPRRSRRYGAGDAPAIDMPPGGAIGTAYDAKRLGITIPSEVPMTVTERAYTSPIWYAPAR